ncbi:MAG: hypothetical protein Q7T38_08030 [Gallionella sp.]|nr:hypothetical protein [Gallionella sp.]
MSSIKQADLRELLVAVGFVTVNWALMERQMDNIINLSFVSFGGVSGHNKKPSVFVEKVKYLMGAFDQNNELSQHKTNAIRLIDRAKDFSELRHAFTHGALESLDGSVLTINKLKTKSEYCVDLIKIDLIDFPVHVEEIGGLVTEWTHLSKSILDEHQKRK